MRSHQLSCADVATHESLSHYYTSARVRTHPSSNLAFALNYTPVKIMTESKWMWARQVKSDGATTLIHCASSHNKNKMCLQDHILPWWHKCNTHKVKTLPASTVTLGKKIWRLFFCCLSWEPQRIHNPIFQKSWLWPTRGLRGVAVEKSCPWCPHILKKKNECPIGRYTSTTSNLHIILWVSLSFTVP